MAFDEMRRELVLAREEITPPADDHILDVIDELLIAVETVHARIQELTIRLDDEQQKLREPSKLAASLREGLSSGW
jgi:hypothetical protein